MGTAPLILEGKKSTSDAEIEMPLRNDILNLLPLLSLLTLHHLNLLPAYSPYITSTYSQPTHLTSPQPTPATQPTPTAQPTPTTQPPHLTSPQPTPLNLLPVLNLLPLHHHTSPYITHTHTHKHTHSHTPICKYLCIYVCM